MCSSTIEALLSRRARSRDRGGQCWNIAARSRRAGADEVGGRFEFTRFRAGNTFSSSALTIVWIDGVRSPRYPWHARARKRENRDRRRPRIVDAGTFELPPTLSNEPLRAASSGRWGSRLPTPGWFCTARRRRVPLDGRPLPCDASLRCARTLRAKGRRRRTAACARLCVSTEIGRNDRDRDASSCCGVPQ